MPLYGLYALCGISSGSSLFTKVPISGFAVLIGLMSLMVLMLQQI